MKNWFLMQLFFAPDATTAAAAVPEPTSPKLEELNAQYIAAFDNMVEVSKAKGPLSTEAKDAKLAMYKIDGEINAEKSAIKKAENDARIAQARNERLKLNQIQLDAFLAWKTAPKNTAADKLAEMETAFNTAKEAVDNELLAKFASSKPAKAAAPGDNSTGGTKESGNKDAILELARSGKSHKEIEDAGYKRSTVWHTINNAKKAGETFPNA